MKRLLSNTEINKAMTCQAQWDFAYGGQLAGSALKSKRVAPLLSAGRAWGAAIASYHVTLDGALAVAALKGSLESDADRQREFGLHDPEAHNLMLQRLLLILLHYVDTCEDWRAEPITERQVQVPLRSRTGLRASSRYELLAYVDATRMIGGRPWLVEFKLRTQLTAVEFIQLDRQIRRYAWAWWQATGRRPAGVEVHERLNEAPRPPRMILGPGARRSDPDPERVPSHAKDQLTTVNAYVQNCNEHMVEPNPETVEALRNRRWQQVVPIMFRDGELEEAGAELISAAKTIRDLDNGELYPVRNARPQNCRGCAYREICPSPDNALVDALFERVPAKRDRVEEEVT